MASSSETTIGGRDERFPDTQWSLIQEAIRSSSDPKERLDRLIRLYWKPVYATLRRACGLTVEDAKDLAQDFFARFLDGRLLQQADRSLGSFRRFLKASVENFVKDWRRDARALKRGGGRPLLSLDAADVEALIGDHREATPEELFDRAWAMEVLTQAMELTEASLRAEGKEKYVEVFRACESLGDGVAPPGHRELAQRLGLSEVDVKNYLAFSRHRYRDSLIRIIRDYVSSGGDVLDEIERLF